MTFKFALIRIAQVASQAIGNKNTSSFYSQRECVKESSAAVCNHSKDCLINFCRADSYKQAIVDAIIRGHYGPDPRRSDPTTHAAASRGAGDGTARKQPRLQSHSDNSTHTAASSSKQSSGANAAGKSRSSASDDALRSTAADATTAGPPASYKFKPIPVLGCVKTCALSCASSVSV
jgi:hypothetical protein